MFVQMIETKRLRIHIASRDEMERMVKCGFAKTGVIGEEGPRYIRVCGKAE